MSAHGCAMATSVAAFARRDSEIRRSVLLRFVTAMMATALALFLVQPAHAQQRDASFVVPYTGTLKKINDSGEIRIGYRENSPPFAFLDAERKPSGYSLDLCEIVVEEIAAGMALPADEAIMRLFAESDTSPGVIFFSMSEQDVQRVRAVMLGLDKTEAGQKILDKLGYKGYEGGDPQQLAALTKWLGY